MNNEGECFVIFFQPRDMDDHISWLLDKDDFREALDKAEKNQKMLKRHSVLVCVLRLILQDLENVH